MKCEEYVAGYCRKKVKYKKYAEVIKCVECCLDCKNGCGNVCSDIEGDELSKI